MLLFNLYLRRIMVATIIICAVTCLLMILSVLFFPKIKIGKVKLDTYWLITLVGAIVLLITGLANVNSVWTAMTTDTAINPLKILVLFICMTGLSIFLDEVGFFRYLANATLKKAKNGQIKLFIYLYLIVSVLTVFTSNDVIVLSFTPFICYFAKNAKINPIPFLAGEFVAANTWSMMFIIGNPTNIYLAGSAGIDFISYLKVMALPTLMAGGIAFLLLFLIFRKQLSKPIEPTYEDVKITDKPLFIIGLCVLITCTVLLAIGSYINLEMWLVTLISFISLILAALIICLCRKQKPTVLFNSLKRLPYELIPFILSMFVMIIALNDAGISKAISDFFGTSTPILKYGFASFFASNLINNIPMSVLFSSILSNMPSLSLPAVFATIIGSNLGAFFSPIGALAGIMWSNMLNDHNLKFGYLSFLKIGVTIAIPTLIVALLGLMIVI